MIRVDRNGVPQVVKYTPLVKREVYRQRKSLKYDTPCKCI